MVEKAVVGTRSSWYQFWLLLFHYKLSTHFSFPSWNPNYWFGPVWCCWEAGIIYYLNAGKVNSSTMCSLSWTDISFPMACDVSVKFYGLSTVATNISSKGQQQQESALPSLRNSTGLFKPCPSSKGSSWCLACSTHFVAETHHSWVCA